MMQSPNNARAIDMAVPFCCFRSPYRYFAARIAPPDAGARQFGRYVFRFVTRRTRICAELSAYFAIFSRADADPTSKPARPAGDVLQRR
jgi:hypothetical protein